MELGICRADEFIVDLCRDSTPNQIVLACVAPRGTLSETLDDVNQKIRDFASDAAPPGEFGPNDVLLVPNLNWTIDHRFTELEGADKRIRNPGFNGYYIKTAAQTIRFRLDRSGAELASESKLYVKPLPTYYICDRPFLIFMRKRGQECPFFAVWVDNAELLSKPEI